METKSGEQESNPVKEEQSEHIVHLVHELNGKIISANT